MMTPEHEKEVNHDHELHHKFIETLIKKEEQRIKFREAVIEKTVSSLIWSILVSFGIFLATFFKDHWR